ncbi:uncharacterized protein RJT21DRAFT_123040 [Scheffersomyces amazonensis]|uniref:uncharacterized protein n=1 Tax=Scheffersomyces amazonensis TaxID=1078765 RepID=UPI00315C9DBE
MLVGLGKNRLVPKVYSSLRYSVYVQSRFQHVKSETNPFLYLNNFNSLNKKIQQVYDTTNDHIGDSIVINALKSCNELGEEFPIQQKLDINSIFIKESKQVIDTLIKDDRVKFTSDLLKQIFVLNLPTILNLQLINLYYEKNPSKSTIIDKSIALIALRNALNNAEFQRAITISDITVGHPNYIEHNHQILKKGVIKLASTAIGITLISKYGVNLLIEFGELTSGWRHLGSINSMILTYFLNSSFFVTTVRIGRQLISSGGDYLTWQKGAFYTHWFRHADEMLFCSKIVEADRELNGGENNPEIIKELCRTNENTLGMDHTLKPGYTRDGKKIRLLEAKDNLEDLKLQAYWMSGGDGFEWVEPDQDPATLIWKDHLAQYNQPSIKSNTVKTLKWADELIDQK